jgi:hypothetical protein
VAAVSRYKPKCTCGVQLVDGVCPEGCSAYKAPKQAIRLSERGRKEESRVVGWLTAAEVDRGMTNVMRRR